MYKTNLLVSIWLTCSTYMSTNLIMLFGNKGTHYLSGMKPSLALHYFYHSTSSLFHIYVGTLLLRILFLIALCIEFPSFLLPLHVTTTPILSCMLFCVGHQNKAFLFEAGSIYPLNIWINVLAWVYLHDGLLNQAPLYYIFKLRDKWSATEIPHW